MRLDIAKSVVLHLSPDAVWAFVREPECVAACVPSLETFAPAAGPGRYDTLLVERLGPFSVRIPLAAVVSEDAAARRMTARVSGDDRAGQARVRGEVRATVEPVPGGARLEVASDVEVLGRLAALGAGPLRRRGDQVFEQFIRALEARLEGGGG